MPIKDEWFNGDQDAINFYRDICVLADNWDNLIDRDKPVSNAQINDSFLTCLYRLPLNPVYNKLQIQIAPMWLMVISAYETANTFETNKDEHGVEISHMLRYAAGHIISYVMIYCLGIEKAKEFVPEMWKNLVRERFDEYRLEHTASKTGGAPCAD